MIITCETHGKLRCDECAYIEQLKEERDEARQANAALQKTISDWHDFCTEKSMDAEAKCYENVLNLLTQYDTAPKEDKTDEQI